MDKSKWFFLESVRPEATAWLICFPYSGAGPSFFAPWAAELPAAFNLMPVCYPMREKRRAESMPTSIGQLAEDFANDCACMLGNVPFVFYGHCTGSIVAYETALVLKRRYGISPNLFVAASSPAPFDCRIEPLDRSLTNKQFAERMADMGLVRHELAGDSSFVEYFIPVIRADYLLHQEYTADKLEMLNCPVISFYGSRDAALTRERVEKWARFTDNGYRSFAVDEGHFFEKKESLSFIFSCMSSELEKQNG